MTLLLLLLVLASSLAWVPPAIRHRKHEPSIAKLAMIPVDEVPEAMEGVIGGAIKALSNPEEEAAVLTDLAEAMSDLGVLFSDETFLLRFSAVIGKMLELMSDYLPDQSIRSDELVFDIPIIVTSAVLFVRSALPILKAQFVELDELDHTVFELCFQPVGVTLLQFNCMKATGCFEWITCEAGTILIDENDYCNISMQGDNEEGDQDPCDWKYLYWQLDGSIIRSFKGKVFSVIKRASGKHIDNPEAQGLLGDTRFLLRLDLERRRQQINPIQTGGNDGSTSPTVVPIATTTVGPEGARLLRIDSHKLFDLMDHDERLESSIRFLLLKSLQLKISHMLNVIHEKNDATIIDQSVIASSSEVEPPIGSAVGANGEQ